MYSAQLKAFLEQLAKGEAQELIIVAFGFREPLLPGLAVLEGSNPEATWSDRPSWSCSGS